MPQIRNFAEAHRALKAYVPGDVASSYTLSRMRSLMDWLGNPQDKLKVIHIAGTSGKSSTCYYMAALLGQAGQKVGLSISPHVDEINERVQINLKPVDEANFCKLLTEFIGAVSKSRVKPTYFELIVAMAYWYFAQQKVYYAVMEVGLGGLLDGTNVVTSANKIAVITDIGLDHTHILGKNLEQIAAQKAGIIQPHNVVFMYGQNQNVMRAVKKRCIKQHAQLHELSSGDIKQIKGLPPFQSRNFNLASKVYEYLCSRDELPQLTAAQKNKAAHIIVPARMEAVKAGNKTIIFDGSHNAQKMAALAKGIKKLYAGQKVAAIISFVEHKEPYAAEALKHLLPLLDTLIITSFKAQQDTHKRSMRPELIAALCDKQSFSNYRIIANPAAAFRALKKQPESILVVTGSFYLLNHIRPLILKA